MILACCAGTLAENWERGRPRDSQPGQIARFLERTQDPEWMQVVGGVSAAYRFGDNFRNALVHTLRVRRGDEFRSDDSVTAFCTSIHNGRNACFHTVMLFEKVDASCRAFLDDLTNPEIQDRVDTVRYVLNFLGDKRHAF